MSKVTIAGDVNGTGVFTIAAPNGNTNRTLTLPDEAGTMLTSASDLAATKLTGALPAIDGSALTGIVNPVVAFHASDGPTQNSSVKYIINFGTVRVDTHSAGSATRFTAPISGMYVVSYGWMTLSAAPNRSHAAVNGVKYGTDIYVGGAIYDRTSNSFIVSLNVSDYVEIMNNVNGGTEGNRHPGYDYFTVHKL